MKGLTLRTQKINLDLFFDDNEENKTILSLFKSTIRIIATTKKTPFPVVCVMHSKSGDFNCQEIVKIFSDLNISPFIIAENKYNLMGNVVVFSTDREYSVGTVLTKTFL